MSGHYFRCKEHIVDSQHIRNHYRAVASTQEQKFNLAVKQYTPLDNTYPKRGDVTIIACHAAGTAKELYEPLFDDLHAELKRCNAPFSIRSIWIADTVSHGASAVLNEGSLGIDASWSDHARDLLHMVNQFRDDMPMPLVGLGHSMGATTIIQLALMHPRLFTTVICIEAILNKTYRGMNFAPVYFISMKKDIWPSRKEAAKQIQKGVVQKTWDPRVIEREIQYGLRELPTLLYPKAPDEIARAAEAQGTTPVTTATTKHHYVRSFARPAYPSVDQPLKAFEPDPRAHYDISKEQHCELKMPIYRPEAGMVFEQLPFLRPSCCFIHGADSTFSSSTAQGRADKLAATGIAVGGSGGTKAGKVADIAVDGGGHFLPLEQPAAVAREVSLWLCKAMSDEASAVRSEAESWSRVRGRAKEMVDDEWMLWMEKHFGRKAAAHKRDKPAKPRL